MKKNHTFAKGIFQIFLASFLCIFTINSSNAQCISDLNFVHEQTSMTVSPNQCTYTVMVCITVNNPTLSSLTSLSFSISTGSNTASENVLGGFTDGQIVCQDLDIIIPNCDETALVNIDVEASDMACDIANYDGPLNQLSSPLAVEFAYLEGYQLKNETVIEWISETETANDYFEVEHSIDGRSFKLVEKIDGGGNTAEANAYKYFHRFPYNGLNYYRIKMVDFFGEITYSNVITIELESKDVINVFPTTVESELNIKIFHPISKETAVSVFNSTGKRIATYSIPVGNNSLQIPTGHLIAGVYYVKIKLQGEGVITKPFVKKTM